MTEEEKKALEVMKALRNEKLREDFLFYGRTLVKADQVKREEYGLLTKPPKSAPRRLPAPRGFFEGARGGETPSGCPVVLQIKPGNS